MITAIIKRVKIDLTNDTKNTFRFKINPIAAIAKTI